MEDQAPGGDDNNRHHQQHERHPQCGTTFPRTVFGARVSTMSCSVTLVYVCPVLIYFVSSGQSSLPLEPYCHVCKNIESKLFDCLGVCVCLYLVVMMFSRCFLRSGV